MREGRRRDLPHRPAPLSSLPGSVLLAFVRPCAAPLLPEHHISDGDPVYHNVGDVLLDDLLRLLPPVPELLHELGGVVREAKRPFGLLRFPDGLIRVVLPAAPGPPCPCGPEHPTAANAITTIYGERPELNKLQFGGPAFMLGTVFIPRFPCKLR